MANVSQRGDKWRAEVCINRKRKAKTFNGKDAAEAWAAIQEGTVKVSPASIKKLATCHITEEEIVANAMPFNKVSGVYFLIKGSGIIYVGKSTHLFRRLAEHSMRGVDFDSYYFIMCEPSRADILEPYYIKKFEPKLNTVFLGGVSQLFANG